MYKRQVPGLLTDLKVTLHIDLVVITTAMDVVGGGEDAEQPVTTTRHILLIAVSHTLTVAQDMEHQPVMPCVREQHSVQMEALVQHPTPVYAQLDGVVPRVHQM